MTARGFDSFNDPFSLRVSHYLIEAVAGRDTKRPAGKTKGNMMKRLTRFFGLIGTHWMAMAILFVAALPDAAKTAEARPAASEKADALLVGLIETNDPGLAVLVAQDGKILLKRATAWPIGNIIARYLANHLSHRVDWQAIHGVGDFEAAGGRETER